MKSVCVWMDVTVLAEEGACLLPWFESSPAEGKAYEQLTNRSVSRRVDFTAGYCGNLEKFFIDSLLKSERSSA